MDLYLRVLSYLFLACWWLWLEFNQSVRAFLKFNRQQFAIVRLYWQRPTARPDGNKALYWFLMVPTLIYAFGFFVSVAESTDPQRKWLEFDFLVFCFAFCNLIYIPKSLIVSPDGIYWERLYPWERIMNFSWKSDPGGTFFCFTPEPDEDKTHQVIYVGPMTGRDRWLVDTALKGLWTEQPSHGEDAGS